MQPHFIEYYGTGELTSEAAKLKASVPTGEKLSRLDLKDIQQLANSAMALSKRLAAASNVPRHTSRAVRSVVRKAILKALRALWMHVSQAINWLHNVAPTLQAASMNPRLMEISPAALPRPPFDDDDDDSNGAALLRTAQGTLNVLADFPWLGSRGKALVKNIGHGIRTFTNENGTDIAHLLRILGARPNARKMILDAEINTSLVSWTDSKAAERFVSTLRQLRSNKPMDIDTSELTAALEAVVDPESARALVEWWRIHLPEPVQAPVPEKAFAYATAACTLFHACTEKLRLVARFGQGDLFIPVMARIVTGYVGEFPREQQPIATMYFAELQAGMRTQGVPECSDVARGGHGGDEFHGWKVLGEGGFGCVFGLPDRSSIVLKIGVQGPLRREFKTTMAMLTSVIASSPQHGQIAMVNHCLPPLQFLPDYDAVRDARSYRRVINLPLCGFSKRVPHGTPKGAIVFPYASQSLQRVSVTWAYRQAAGHLKNVALVLSAMNGAGWFHLDIKQDNILFHKDMVYVADFGLVSRADETFPPSELIGADVSPVYYPLELMLFCNGAFTSTSSFAGWNFDCSRHCLEERLKACVEAPVRWLSSNGRHVVDGFVQDMNHMATGVARNIERMRRVNPHMTKKEFVMACVPHVDMYQFGVLILSMALFRLAKQVVISEEEQLKWQALYAHAMHGCMNPVWEERPSWDEVVSWL